MRTTSSRWHPPLALALWLSAFAAMTPAVHAISPPCDDPDNPTAPCGPGPIWVGEGQSFLSCSTDFSGTVAFDANTTKLRLCTGTAWVNIDTSATAPGIPGGSDTQVQFNDGGSLGGDAGLTYNKTTDTLTGSVGSFVTMTTSTKFYGANGTSANPAYVFTNANDTGLYLPATGVLGISVGGTERARVTSAGVSTTGYVSGTAFYSTDSNAYFYNDLATPSLVMDSGNDYFGFNRAQNRYDFNIGGTSYARVTSGGVSTTALVATNTISTSGGISATNISTTNLSGSGLAVTGVVHGVSVTFYTTAGTYSYIHPSNTVYIEVEVYGAGGGGGGVDGQNTAGTLAVSGGGGAGGYAIKWINNPSNTYTVTVGAGGGGSTGTATGTTGGTSGFTQVATSIAVSATGGTGAAGEAQSTGSTGSRGASGAGSGGDVNAASPAQRGITRWYNSVSTAFNYDGGYGQPSMFGPGGGYGSNGNGGNAAYCAAGGGGVILNTQTATNYSGGDGAAGCVLIKAFY